MVVKDERKRYILIEFLNDKPEKSILNKNLRLKISRLAGEIFLSRSSLVVMDYKEKFYIVRCTHITRDIVEAALNLLEWKDNFLKTIKVSGTIKGIDRSLADNEEED